MLSYPIVQALTKTICIQIVVVKLISSNVPMNIADGAERRTLVEEQISKL